MLSISNIPSTPVIVDSQTINAESAATLAPATAEPIGITSTPAVLGAFCLKPKINVHVDLLKIYNKKAECLLAWLSARSMPSELNPLRSL